MIDFKSRRQILKSIVYILLFEKTSAELCNMNQCPETAPNCCTRTSPRRIPVNYCCRSDNQQSINLVMLFTTITFLLFGVLTIICLSLKQKYCQKNRSVPEEPTAFTVSIGVEYALPSYLEVISSNEYKLSSFSKSSAGSSVSSSSKEGEDNSAFKESET